MVKGHTRSTYYLVSLTEVHEHVAHVSDKRPCLLQTALYHSTDLPAKIPYYDGTSAQTETPNIDQTYKLNIVNIEHNLDNGSRIACKKRYPTYT